jgi:hypothetical protein
MQNNKLEIVYIGDLPKDKLLFYLWYNAKISDKYKHCGNIVNYEIPNLQTIKEDLNNIYKNNGNYFIGEYYFKELYIDIFPDNCYVHGYNLDNGYKHAQKIISMLKMEELRKCVTNYYISS